MNTWKNLYEDLKITLPQKLIPLNLVLFFLIPAIRLGIYVNNLTIYYIVKIPLLYICCLIIPLLIFYIITCTTLILDDILKKQPLDSFWSYYL